MMRRNEGARQFERVVDGVVVSVIGYEERAGRTTLLYTATEPAFRGQGHATALVAEVLADLRARRSPYVASCPLVRAYLAAHPEVPPQAAD